MVVIEILKHEDIDVQEIVQFTMEAQQQLDVPLKCGRTREEVEKFVCDAADIPFYYVLARKNNKLVGWAGLYVFTESMVYLDS